MFDYEPCGFCDRDHAYEYADAVRIHATMAIDAARTHAHCGSMASSAQLNLDDADQALADQQYIRAIDRAVRSLAYSVGVFHPTYREVQSVFG